jgi:hypothetical protein
MSPIEFPMRDRAFNIRRPPMLALSLAASAAMLLAPADLPGPWGPDSAWSQQEGGRGGAGGGRGGMRGGRMGGMAGMGGMGGGMRDIREMLEPDFMRRDVPLFVAQLDLDDTQALIVTTLMGDYEADYADASGRVQEQMGQMGREMFQNMVTPQMRERFETEARSIRDEIERMREQAGGELDPAQIREIWRDRMGRVQQQMMEEQGPDGIGGRMSAMMGAMFDRLQEWAVRKERMRGNFVDGLKAQLRDEQLALWPAFERFLVREKSLPRGRLSGEDLNLFMVVDDAVLSEESLDKIDAILDEYEIALDDALRRRDQAVAQGSPQMYQAIQRGDVAGAVRSMERQINARVAVRDLNERYRAQIVAALGQTDEARALDRAILLAGYERIYSPTPTEQLFATVMEMPSLSPEQLEAIVDLQTAFLMEMGSMNQQLLQLTRRWEPQQQIDEAERFVTVISSLMAGAFNPGGFGFEGGPQNPMQDSMQRRGELGRAYRQRLEGLLTPEQVEALPRQRGRGGQMAGGAGGGGWQMGEEARAEMIRRFDRDGDGELSAEERREMMRVLREEMGEGMGQRGGDGARGRGQQGGDGARGGRGQGGRGQGGTN